MSRKGEPQICDFGAAKIAEERTKNMTASPAVGDLDTLRYLAPELIEGGNVPPTTNSDAYSFAMLMLECIAEKIPFSDCPPDIEAIRDRILGGRCPPRPDGPDPRVRVPIGLWSLMLRCWDTKCNHRPTMEQIHSFLLPQPR